MDGFQLLRHLQVKSAIHRQSILEQFLFFHSRYFQLRYFALRKFIDDSVIDVVIEKLSSLAAGYWLLFLLRSRTLFPVIEDWDEKKCRTCGGRGREEENLHTERRGREGESNQGKVIHAQIIGANLRKSGMAGKC